MYVWTLNFSKRSACSYYRIEVPMNQLGAMNLAQIYEETGANAEESTIARMYSDVAHFYAVAGVDFLHQFRRMKAIKSSFRNGEEIHPPALIYDHDDNNDFVHPFNTTFCKMGVRGFPDAKLLEPGDCLSVEDADGNLMFQIEDMKTKYEEDLFDIKRNLFNMKVRHAIIREAHGVTVSTPALAKYMRDVIGAKNVYVFPNTIVPDHYEKIRAVRTDDSIRVLWQGGMSHLIDWYPLRGALREVAQKYPQVKWVIFGEWFNWIHGVIPDDRVEHHPWVEYDAYKLKRGLLNIDINLCPLANNIFNASKSAIKWYEASFSEQPEATLAARTHTFSEIVDGQTGLLYNTPEEFVQKLSALIEDADLRRRLADGARSWVLANRTPAATVPGLADFYAETRARQRREIGKPVIATASLADIKKVAQPLRR